MTGWSILPGKTMSATAYSLKVRLSVLAERRIIRGLRKCRNEDANGGLGRGLTMLANLNSES